MDRHQLDHLLGSFCHLDPTRSFPFDSGLSLLCHRCTAIYSTFFIVTLFASTFRWRGQFFNLRSKAAVGSIALILLVLCGIQVGVQEFLPGHGGGEFARIFSGSLVAIGLFQLSQLARDDFPLPRGIWLHPILLVPILGIHFFLLNQSFFYNSLTTLVGLIWLYHQINLQVLEPWLKEKTFAIRHGLIITFILLEWTALYAINVLKIHV